MTRPLQLGRLYKSTHEILLFSESSGGDPPAKSKRAAQQRLHADGSKARESHVALAANLDAARRFKSAFPIARNSGSEGRACGRRCLSQATASAISWGWELCAIGYLSDMTETRERSG